MGGKVPCIVLHTPFEYVTKKIKQHQATSTQPKENDLLDLLLFSHFFPMFPGAPFWIPIVFPFLFNRNPPQFKKGTLGVLPPSIAWPLPLSGSTLGEDERCWTRDRENEHEWSIYRLINCDSEILERNLTFLIAEQHKKKSHWDVFFWIDVHFLSIIAEEIDGSLQFNLCRIWYCSTSLKQTMAVVPAHSKKSAYLGLKKHQ